MKTTNFTRGIGSKTESRETWIKEDVRVCVTTTSTSCPSMTLNFKLGRECTELRSIHRFTHNLHKDLHYDEVLSTVFDMMYTFNDVWSPYVFMRDLGFGGVGGN